MSAEAPFAAALCRPETHRPKGLRTPSGTPATRRFDVYRNNVTVALCETLAQAFPVVRRLVGEDFFTAMARDFIRDHPPETPIMALYGARLPGWLLRFPPVATLPYLPEVAAIEQARREAVHAADAEPLDPQRLSALSPDALAGLVLKPHPSVRLISTRHPALAIWARNADRPDLAQEPPGEILICRPALSLLIRPAPHATTETLANLARGLPLGRALPEGTDHAAIFACLFTTGALQAQGDPT